MKSFYTLLLIFFCCALARNVSSQWRQHLDEIFSNEALAHVQLSVTLTNTRNERVFEHNSDLSFIPASIYKLIPSLILYDQMGATYRYVTGLGYTGELLDGGTLYGNLVIVGSGDPSLGHDRNLNSHDIESLTRTIISHIRQSGITCIEGDILIDGRIFDNVAVHESWTWDDLSNYYASGVHGFNVHENYYTIYFSRANEPSRSTSIDRFEPFISGLVLNNGVLTGVSGSGDNAYIYGSPYSLNKEIKGTIPPGKGFFSIKGAIPDPGAFYTQYLKDALTKENLSVAGSVFNGHQDINKDMKIIGRLESPDLKTLVISALEESNNLYCDAFMKTLGLMQSAEGSFENGVRTCMAYLQGEGISTKGVKLQDGSGLSMRNRVTGAFMNAFLLFQLKELGEETLLGLLPQPGKGTLENLLSGYPGRDRMWLKSGSMNGILTYSGFIRSKSGSMIAITVMANGQVRGNTLIRRQFEKIFKVIGDGYNE